LQRIEHIPIARDDLAELAVVGLEPAGGFSEEISLGLCTEPFADLSAGVCREFVPSALPLGHIPSQPADLILPYVR